MCLRQLRGGSILTKCPVCNTDNLEFSTRCISCGSFLQQSVRTLDLFSTIFELWRHPVFAIRRILVAEHKNYTVLIAVLEAVTLSFLSLYIVKAADIYSVELWKLIVTGTGLALVVFLPALYVFFVLSYLILGPKKRGVTIKGFISGIVYSLHPLAFSAAVFLPATIAVFGPYAFSNNPPPQVINPLPFYFLGFLGLASGIAALVFTTRLVHILFGKRIRVTVLTAVFLCVFAAALEIAKHILLA